MTIASLTHYGHVSINLREKDLVKYPKGHKLTIVKRIQQKND